MGLWVHPPTYPQFSREATNCFRTTDSSTWAPLGCTHPRFVLLCQRLSSCVLYIQPTLSVGALRNFWGCAENSRSPLHYTFSIGMRNPFSLFPSLSSSSTVLMTLGNIKYLIYPGTVFPFCPYNPKRLILLLYSSYRRGNGAGHRQMKWFARGHTSNLVPKPVPKLLCRGCVLEL